jgi:hypothetical protein
MEKQAGMAFGFWKLSVLRRTLVMSILTQLQLQSTKASAPAPGTWTVDGRAALRMGQGLRLSSRFGFQTVTEVRYHNHEVKT